MKKILSIALLFFVITSHQLHAQQTQPTTIGVPVTSLWSQPTENQTPYTYPLFSKDIPTHVTQLLYGEPITIMASNNEWIKISADEQLVYDPTTNIWDPITGWIKKEAICFAHQLAPNIVISTPWTTICSQTDGKLILSVCMGTMLHARSSDKRSCEVVLHDGTIGLINPSDVLPLKDIPYNNPMLLRSLITSHAQRLLGMPYVWGGRSVHHRIMRDNITGPDCSGFINLVYRSVGLVIPRNSHAQFVASTLIDSDELLLGDLAFFAPEKNNDGKMNHVLMYLGNDIFIEATGKKGVEKIRTVTAQERFGKPLARFEQGELVNSPDGNFRIYFGTLLCSTKPIVFVIEQ